MERIHVDELLEDDIESSSSQSVTSNVCSIEEHIDEDSKIQDDPMGDNDIFNELTNRQERPGCHTHLPPDGVPFCHAQPTITLPQYESLVRRMDANKEKVARLEQDMDNMIEVIRQIPGINEQIPFGIDEVIHGEATRSPDDEDQSLLSTCQSRRHRDKGVMHDSASSSRRRRHHT